LNLVTSLHPGYNADSQCHIYSNSNYDFLSVQPGLAI